MTPLTIKYKTEIRTDEPLYNMQFCLETLRFVAIAFFVEQAIGSTAPKVKHVVIPPHGWAENGVPSPDHTITLRIGLPQPNFPVLAAHLYEVSDPNHARYGAYLSKQEVEALVAPHQETIQIIDEWLTSHGIDPAAVTRSTAKDWAILTVPVNLAEKMLDTVSSLCDLVADNYATLLL